MANAYSSPSQVKSELDKLEISPSCHAANSKVRPQSKPSGSATSNEAGSGFKGGPNSSKG